MSDDDILDQIKELEDVMYSLKKRTHPVCKQFQPTLDKHNKRSSELLKEREAALRECQEKHLKDTGQLTTPAYEDCVRRVEEEIQEKRDASHAEWKIDHDAFEARLSALQQETSKRLKELRAQSAGAYQAKYAEMARIAVLQQMQNAPIEVLRESAANMSYYPPEVQEVMRARLEGEPSSGPEPQPIPAPTAFPPDVVHSMINWINQVPPESLERMAPTLSGYPPEVQDAIRERLAAAGAPAPAAIEQDHAAGTPAESMGPSPIPKPQPAAQPDPTASPAGREPGDLYDPDDYHSPFPMLDIDIKQEIQEMDPRTVKITYQVFNGLLELASGRDTGAWVGDTKKINKAIKTFITIVSDKDYDSDAAVVAAKKLAVIVAEMAAKTATNQFTSRAKSVGDLLLLAVQESTRAVWGDQAAAGLPNNLYDAAAMIVRTLPKSDGIIDPGPMWKYWSGKPLDPQY
ncbi:MAG: hypothetical protein JXA97_12020 [Anaerolineales bacterium]|nr:hypothetical protein [Anaerolineales bacterium]